MTSVHQLFRSIVATIPVLTALAGLSPALALDGGRYGEVKIATPDGENRGYVVLYSDASGWTAREDKIAASLAAEGALVIGVDTAVYLAKIAPAKKTCDQLVGDVESLSRQIQREYSGAQYQFPILVGIGAGGTLAGAVLAEAPANTLSGAISLNPAPTLKMAHPLCPGAPVKPAGKGVYAYGPIQKLSGFWSVVVTADASPETRANVRTLKDAGMPIDLFNENGAPELILTGLLEPHLAPPSAGSIADLPLVELPVDGDQGDSGAARAEADAGSGMMAVVLSGDGGWRDIDKSIAENLQQHGVPVIGWDCLRYFWRLKTPEQTAADLTDVLETYGAKWHAQKIALIGFSFGADVLPFAYNLLPQHVKRQVVLVSLLAFETKADWEISVSGWLGAPPTDAAIPVGPAIDLMPPKLIQCLYGKDEEDTACPQLADRGAQVVETEGGHHFDGDYDGLAERILGAFRAHAAS